MIENWNLTNEDKEMLASIVLIGQISIFQSQFLMILALFFYTLMLLLFHSFVYPVDTT